ncbi:isatin hydrolase-like [Zophobas morio]|uniref:isatin hydrolase-like n=1 Tax=Zophobas morio TaxID=2755281 RepID=UPI00308364ED
MKEQVDGAGEHGGTHFDAPYHFNKEGWKVPDVPITRLVAKSATIDLRRTETKSLASKHLENWKRQKGVFHTNTFLIIKFGWSKYWNNRNQYIGIDVNGNIDFPVKVFPPQAATWIVNSGNIVGVGLDAASVDPEDSSEFMTDRILTFGGFARKGIQYVVVLSMKLKDGTGTPERGLAVLTNYL